MPGTHSILSPSSALRWINCTRSARLNEKFIERFGEETSEYAEEGTKAHRLAELKLRLLLKEIDKESYAQLVAPLGDIPNEMEVATDYYADFCHEQYIFAVNQCPDALMLVEQRLDITPWVPECYGTGDCIVVSDMTLAVIDFKYGKGVPVSAVGNPQARCYGLGALNEFGDLYTFDEINTFIIQPRLDSVSSETTTRSELLSWGEELKPRAQLAYEGAGTYASGPWCKFCNARAICSERVAEVMKVVMDAGLDTPDVIDDNRVAGIYKALPLLKEWTGAFEEHVKKQALRGQKIAGFKLVRGKKPPRVFKSADNAVCILTREHIDPSKYMTQPELKSVAAVEKAIGKKAFAELFEDEVIQGEGALTLVPEDDPREEYSSADADFSDLT